MGTVNREVVGSFPTEDAFLAVLQNTLEILFLN